jgi:hypothetical protein
MGLNSIDATSYIISLDKVFPQRYDLESIICRVFDDDSSAELKAFLKFTLVFNYGKC